MTKKQKGIMVWLIIWAGLLIVVLYSPIGSPELYSSSQNYYQGNRIIAVNTGVIPKAPKLNNVSDNSTNEVDIPEVNTLTGSRYTIGNSQTSTGNSNGSYSIQNQSYSNNYSTGMGGSINNGNSLLVSGGSRNSAGSSGVVMTNGITTLSLTSDINNNTTKQSVTNYTSGTGGTDPGGDPTGNPIPIGDGWEILALYGVLYALYKRKHLIFRQAKN